jgi:hypothetical protein
MTEIIDEFDNTSSNPNASPVSPLLNNHDLPLNPHIPPSEKPLANLTQHDSNSSNVKTSFVSLLPHVEPIIPLIGTLLSSSPQAESDPSSNTFMHPPSNDEIGVHPLDSFFIRTPMPDN